MKKLSLILTILLSALTASAQVTTSGITGKVADAHETIIGATIKACHTPSGATYYGVTNANGVYTITGMTA